MFIPNKLPDELISIESILFRLVSDTYDSLRADAKKVREVFENVVFKDQADVETLMSLGNGERVKFINLRELYLKSKCQLAFRNLVIDKLRIFDDKQEFYTSLKDELKSKETPKTELKAELARPASAVAPMEQRVAQFGPKRIQAPVPQNNEMDPDEALAFQLQAELLEEERATQKKARRSGEDKEAVNPTPLAQVPAAEAKPNSSFTQEDEIEILKEKEETEPVEPVDDFALALQLSEEWNTKGIDPSEALKKKNVKKDRDPEFLDEMEAANARAIAQLLESDVRQIEQAVSVPSIEGISLDTVTSTGVAPFKGMEFVLNSDMMTDVILAQAIKEIKENVSLPQLGELDENLSRRMDAESIQMDKEKMDIPGVGLVERTPTARYIDSKSAPNQRLYVRDRAFLEQQTKSIRLECSIGNEININEDCELEIVDIKFGTINITKSRVKIHNASDCNIHVRHNSKVVITGSSLNNTITYSLDSELDMPQDLWNKNTITR